MAPVTNARTGRRQPTAGRRPSSYSRGMPCVMRLLPSAAGWSFIHAPLESRRIRAAGGSSRSSPEKARTSGDARSAIQAAAGSGSGARVASAVLVLQGRGERLFAAGADQLTKGMNAKQALMIGIRCERGSHRFFKRYGERFEDSEGKQVFLEFADEESVHLELLTREYRALAKRHAKPRQGPTSTRETGTPDQRLDSPFLHCSRFLHAIDAGRREDTDAAGVNSAFGRPTVRRPRCRLALHRPSGANAERRRAARHVGADGRVSEAPSDASAG